MRIAIIDDDTVLSSSITSALARNGWACRTHADGRSFVATLHRERYDAYIVDSGLPDMSGLDVLRAIRTRVPVTVPVLCLTARDTEQDVIEALEAGADDFVVKPARIGELLARAHPGGGLGPRQRDPPERHYLLAPVYSYGYRLEHLLTSTATAGSASCGEPG